MQKNKLYLLQILGSLSRDEMKNFEKLVSSPFFSRGRNYRPILKELIKFYPTFDNPELTFDKLHSNLYPNSKFNSQLIRNLVNGLTRLAEEFLYQKNVKRTQSFYEIVCDELLRRNLTRPAKMTIKKIPTPGIEKFDQKTIKSLSSYHRISREYHLQKDDYTKEYESYSKYALYYLYSFIFEASIIIEDMNILDYNFNLSFKIHPLYRLISSREIKNITGYIAKNRFENYELIELYSTLLQLSVYKTDQELYQKARDLFKKNFNKFSLEAKYDIYIIFQSRAIFLQQFDHDKYIKETFNIYKETIENNALNPKFEETIEFQTFRSILNYALQLGEIKWAESFIIKYIPWLAAEFRDNMMNYSMARLYCEKKQFEKALEFLSRVKYDSFAMKYDMRVLNLRLYYELGYNEEALSLIDSFRHFISGNRSLSERKQKIQSNFVNYISELFRIRASKDKVGLNRLRKNVLNSGTITNKDWLVEKINQLNLIPDN